MSTIFKDEKGDAWDLALNIGVARGLKESYDFDVFSLSEEAVLSAFVDPAALADAIKFILQDQIDRKDLSDLDFFRRLTGDVIDAAGEALLRAIVNFSPKMQRKAAATLLDRANLKAADQATKAEAMAAKISLDGGA